MAIKSGRDWSGRMVNISTQNVLLERNAFRAGHGVSIGSETGGWIRNATAGVPRPRRFSGGKTMEHR